ncbi:MAG: YidC/Oxa1 family insertase periplasmic-domain containing protein [Phycisphaerales bacterium]|nr:YidC/Oxa1 family insertase periplasmic-domain containing protein [Phycisphaerales bacterium]MCB9862445.1 YidC/Oxa1 family insertase periplasmic-domain containing protein [Phycisphaerales bacterium]
MDNYNKRLFLTLAMCFVATMLYTKFFLAPPPADQTATQPATTQSANRTAPSSSPASAPTDGKPAGIGIEQPSLVSGDSTGDRFSVVGGKDDSLITIGDDTPEGDNPYKLKLVLDPVGASVQTVTLAEHRETVKRRKKDPTPPAYRLLEPLKNEANGMTYRSFVAESIRLPDDDVEIKLSDLTWKASRVADESGETVRFSAVIRDRGFEAFELARTFHISRNSKQFELRWDVRNLTEAPYKILLTGSGPIGVERADSRFDSPRVMVALIEPDGRVIAGQHMTKAQVTREEDRTHNFKAGDDHIYWYALSNKYFTCLVYPKPLDDKSAYATYLDRVSAMPRFPDEEDHGDMTAEQVLAPPKPIGPGDSVTMAMDVYCGDKSEKTFESIPAATARHYILTTSPDRSACTFESIGVLMRWLLDKLHLIVRNYGVAIIILVIVVRVCLHPITRKGQVNMMKMQKNQARLKPKLELLQKQFKNDKQRLGEETMKLYREEGINPASTLSGCLPMVLQTPIWIALYTTLNTGISLRHQPFFGYIRDLSAPDVLVHFDWTLKIPFLWKMMGPINSLNILPIIMAGVMFAQMKLSQKMAKDKKADEAAEKAKAEGAAAEPAQDMVAQQQKMMMFMMPLFGLMFYNMPSGLCLYILSNSVLGMVELYFIRKKLREDEAAGKLAPVASKPKKQGRMARFLEDLQKKAEEARLAQAQAQGGKPKQPQGGKGKKKPRF